MLDRRTRLTEGSTIELDRARCVELGLDLDAVAASWHGLLSNDVGVRLGRRTVWLPAWFTPAGRRIPPGIARGVLGALRHFATGMSLLFATLLALATIGGIAGMPLLSVLAGVAAIILLSILVREAGHVLMYRLLVGAGAPAIAVVQGINCRVVRLRGEVNADALVALAGPIAPVIMAAATVPLWSLAPAPVGLALIVGLGHAVLIALPFGDGAAIREIMRRR